MGRGLDLGAVGQDQPVDIPSRRQRKLLHLALLRRQLLRVVERRPAGIGRRRLRERARAQGEYGTPQH